MYISRSVIALLATPAVFGSGVPKPISVCLSECSSIAFGSYCKYWQNPPTCHGSNVTCSCDVAIVAPLPVVCDAGCNQVQTGSFCKNWLSPSVCSETDIPCTCTAWKSGTTPVPTSTAVNGTTPVPTSTA
ncbi:hypothetical protein FOZ63_007390, partial [Perkinsus olseni]